MSVFKLLIVPCYLFSILSFSLCENAKNETAKGDKSMNELVDEMLQELRNQNQAIFKHAGHSRILSQKVSEMTKDLKRLNEDNRDLKERLQVVEFKANRKIKKLKTKLGEIYERLNLCNCPSADPKVPERAPSKSKKDRKKLRKKKKERGRSFKKNRRRNRVKQDHRNPDKDVRLYSTYSAADDDIIREEDESYHRYSVDTVRAHAGPARPSYQYEIDMNDNTWRTSLGYNQIFITSGSKNKSEILDVSVGYDACPAPADYPLRVQGAVGTFMAGRPLVCGGRSSIEDYYNDCFYYNVNNDTWTRSTPMLEKRFQATAVMLGSDRWWITGGFSGDYVYNNTEIYNPATGFEPGPNLPEVTFQHCLVKFNATHIFSVGGFPYTNNAWILDFPNGRWTKMSPIHHMRDAPHCAMIERLNGRIEIIVAGGSLPGSELATEIYSVSDNRWRTGPNLPKAIIYGVSIPYRNAMLILGGREMGGDLGELDSVFEYDSSRERWTKRDKKLKSPRTSFVAINLPDYLSCTNNFKPPSTQRKFLYYNTETTTTSNAFFGSFK